MDWLVDKVRKQRSRQNTGHNQPSKMDRQYGNRGARNVRGLRNNRNYQYSKWTGNFHWTDQWNICTESYIVPESYIFALSHIYCCIEYWSTLDSNSSKAQVGAFPSTCFLTSFLLAKPETNLGTFGMQNMHSSTELWPLPWSSCLIYALDS